MRFALAILAALILPLVIITSLLVQYRAEHESLQQVHAPMPAPSPQIDPLTLKRLLYIQDSGIDVKMLSAHPESAEMALERNISKARVDGVLPIRDTGKPSLGELALLDCYLQPRGAWQPDPKVKDEYLAYVRDSFPQFNLDSYIQYVEQRKAAAEGSPSTLP